MDEDKGGVGIEIGILGNELLISFHVLGLFLLSFAIACQISSFSPTSNLCAHGRK